MKRIKITTLLCNATVLIFMIVFQQLAWAKDVDAGMDLEDLRNAVKELRQEAAQLKIENSGLRKMLRALEDDSLYLVVDTENNRVMMRRGKTVLHTAVCGTGSRSFVEEETGRNWFFETPIGSYTVLGKVKDPVWIRPDWSYVEENMPVPPLNDPDRIVRGVLGKYALLIGNGYMIHGTIYTNLLGTHFTHGCISLGDDDLELINKSTRVGTKVYIY
jgi:lipoprotein-anchoring transpeptidase ErfK/SrfK